MGRALSMEVTSIGELFAEGKSQLFPFPLFKSPYMMVHFYEFCNSEYALASALLNSMLIPLH